jgi:diguanylate cyclase (GGDEF)-like protein
VNDARVAGRKAVSAPVARLAELIGLAEADAGSDARKGAEYALEAADLAQALGDRPAYARALFLAGRCADYLLDQETALNRFRDALAEYEAIGDATAQAKTLRAIGFVYDSLGDFPQAIDYELKALALDEATGNMTGRAASLRTIGVIYSKSGDAKTGLDYYEQSLALAEQSGDATEIGKALNNVGINLKNLGRPEEALAAQVRALEMFRASGATMHESAVLNNLGLTQARLGHLEAAEKTLREALLLSERSGYRLGVVNAMRGLGRLYTSQRRFGEAGRLLADALDVAEAHRLKPDQAECHQALAEYFEQTGDFASALKHYRRYHQLERDVLNEATSKQLKALQIRHQVAAAQRDAEIHRLRNIELARAYADLEALNSSLKDADTQKTRLLAQLERQTFEDALTGLANRRFLDQRLAQEFQRARRHRRPLAVAIADLDHFKRVNDTYSHGVGDDVLRAIAHILRDHVRHTDLVARFGGEEFVLVLTETDVEAARVVCEKLRGAVEAYHWEALRPGLAVTISIGICADTEMPSHERMLAAADARLYEAKAAGRNRVVV